MVQNIPSTFSGTRTIWSIFGKNEKISCAAIIATTVDNKYINNNNKKSKKNKIQPLIAYSRTSVARTLMARLPRLFRTRS